METTNVSKEQINLFVVCGKHYVNANRETPSVLSATVEELLDSYLKKLKKIDREKELVRMKLCKKTATKHIDQDKSGRYQFTEDDQIKLYDEFDRIDEEMVEMPCQIVPKDQIPMEGITYDVARAFKGIVME